MRRSTAQPQTLSMGVSAGMGDAFRVALDGDDLEYTYRPEVEAEEHVVLTPDAAAWRSFRQSVERLKGWPWEGRYEQPPERMSTDGVNWSLEVVFADGRASVCDGYDAFPPDGDGPALPASFRALCRAVSRLAGGRCFGWQVAPQPRKAAVKGSQLRLREWVELRREPFEGKLRAASPTFSEWSEGPIKWLSPVSGADFKELRDDLWPLVGVAPSPQAAGWWPKGGPVWDAAGVAPGPDGLGVVLVEAKSHESELRSPGADASYESMRTIEAALAETKSVLGVAPDAAWSRTYYQMANRLAFLHWLRHHAQRPAWLFNVYFLGDRFPSGGRVVQGPADAHGWRPALAAAKATLGLPGEHKLSAYTADVFLAAEPA